MPAIHLANVEGKQLWLPNEARETHMHVMGGSRMGKSYFLEHMIRQDIMQGSGVCVIDPHGEMYDNLVQWLAVSGAAQHRQVHLINPSADGWSVGFNPFCAGEIDPSVRVDFMVDACTKVWGGGDITQTPRLAKCLELVFYALAAHRLSITEARLFSTWPFKERREMLTSDMGDWDRNHDWREFNGYDRRMFTEFMESANTRLLPFASKPRVRRLMGQTENVIDFKQCMDDGDIVLVNLAGKGVLSERDAQVIGAMLFADLYFSAKLRDIKTATQKPFYCYVDECADFVTEHVAKSLDQVAKFGLHLILAHHRMSQLERYGDGFREAMMAGAQTKVIFRVDLDGAAEELGKHLYRREFDIESRKEGLTAPVAVGQEIVWLRGHSDTEAESDSRGGSSGYSNTTSDSVSENESIYEPDDPDAEATGVTHGEGDSSSASESYSESSDWSHSSSQSHTESASESLKTIYEERGVPKSMEEIIHEATVRVRTLPKRNGLVYIAGAQETIQIHTPDLAPAFCLPVQLEKTVMRFVEQSRFTSSDALITAQIAMRRGEPETQVIEPGADDEDAFRHRSPKP